MNLIFVAVAALMMIAFPGHTPAYPGVSRLLAGQTPEGLVCDATPASAEGSLSAPAPSRTANFALSGAYHCQRPVFAERERNPFIERLVQAQELQSRRVAAELNEIARGLAPVAIVTSGLDDVRLENKIAALYRADLAETLGPSRIRLSPADEETAPVLWIELHRSDVPEQMTKLHWRASNETNEAGLPVWRDL